MDATPLITPIAVLQQIVIISKFFHLIFQCYFVSLARGWSMKSSRFDCKSHKCKL
mgnify:CR=1 FL=1